MREIKFRAFYTAGQKIIKRTIETTYDLRYWSSKSSEGPERLISDLNWLQYTGLKDCNGVEIYEGDIVETLTGASVLRRGVVTFNTDNFPRIPAFHVCYKNGEPLDYYYGLRADEECKIIGNIYENPELLES